MKNKKSLKNRLAAGLMSAAMLASAAGTSAMTSLTASAADNDYYEALALSLYFFDANACGSDVTSNCLTWRGNCHVEDEAALLSNATNFDSSFKSLVDPDGDGKVNVGGGYHDAGDHIKFNLTMGFGMSSLAMSEYLNPGIYEKAGCKDHLMAILKRNAEYMMKTTFLNSSGEVATICHVVADGNADHSMMTPPEEQHYDRATYWLTSSQNNSAVCGEMASALAGAAYVWKDSDSAFAAECLKYAKAIYNFGSQHKGNYTGGLGGFYDTDSMCEDELALAQAWLWINGEGAKPTLTPSQGSYNGVYDYYRYTWDKVWQGYAALMYKATKDSTFKSELEFEVNNAGGVAEGKYNGDGWGAARYNCALQMSALAAADGNASSPLATGSKWQMDYILGGNPLGYSFLIGYGSKWPTHYHHRAANPGDLSNNPEAKYTLYGALVGGIDASGNYEDHSDKYQYTEPALDYNGCFALACAGLANLFGGSDKGAANIVSSASEITYPFTFTSGTTVVTPTETETTPTETETQSTTESTTKATETTTQKTDPVETTTQQQTSSGEVAATVTEKTGTWEEDGSPRTYWGVDTTGAKKLIVTLKITSGDTEASGCFNPSNAKDWWEPTDWKATVSNGTVTLEYTPKEGESFVDVHVWWPKNAATLVSAVKVTDQAAQTTTQQTTTQTTTQQTTTQTTTKQTETTAQQTETQTSGTMTKAGDANNDGKVDIVDVIAVNRAILGKDNLSAQGLANVDFNKNGKPDSEEALNILKYIVGLMTESQLKG